MTIIEGYDQEGNLTGVQLGFCTSFGIDEQMTELTVNVGANSYTIPITDENRLELEYFFDTNLKFDAEAWIAQQLHLIDIGEIPDPSDDVEDEEE